MHTDLLKYIGRPYKQFNCFDLVKEFYKDYYGLDLKNYFDGSEAPPPEVVQTLIVSNKGDFEQVGAPEFGDIIVFFIRGIPCHMGVSIGAGRFLHAHEKADSCIDSLSRWKNMIEGYYRHREQPRD